MDPHSISGARGTTDQEALGGILAGDDRAKNLEIILLVTRMITHSLILDEVLGSVLDNAIRVARAERGFLLLADEKGTLRGSAHC